MISRLVVLCVMATLASSLSGCTALKKKFVRQSKNKDETKALIPILRPEEYPPVTHTSNELYRTHYSIYRAYFSDFWATLGKSGNAKREQYLVKEIAAKIDAMADLLIDETRKNDLQKMSARVVASSQELDKAYSLRRYDLVRAEFRRIENDIQHGFKPSLVEKYLKP